MKTKYAKLKEESKRIFAALKLETISETEEEEEIFSGTSSQKIHYENNYQTNLVINDTIKSLESIQQTQSQNDVDNFKVNYSYGNHRRFHFS